MLTESPYDSSTLKEGSLKAENLTNVIVTQYVVKQDVL